MRGHAYRDADANTPAGSHIHSGRHAAIAGSAHGGAADGAREHANKGCGVTHRRGHG